MFKKLWAGWKWFALKIGRVNSMVVLTILYFILLGPFALLRKLFALRLKHTTKDSYWQEYPPVNNTPDGVRKQY